MFVGGYFLVKLERGDIGSILLIECNLKWELNYFLKLFFLIKEKGNRKRTFFCFFGKGKL